jgi:predicted site-specific integrase-resolvase
MGDRKAENFEISTWPTVSEAARLLGVSAASVDIYLKRGKLNFVPTRAGRLIDPRDIERLSRERETKAER